MGLLLSLGVAAGCVSVATSAAAPSGMAGAATEAPAATLSPTSSQRPSPGMAAPVSPPASAASPGAIPVDQPAATPGASASPPPAATPVAGQQRGARLGRATLRKLEAILRTTTGRKRVAGLQVAVRLPDGEIWRGSAGQAEFAPDRPIEDDTVFSIASVTKTFIAALILRLAEEGKLDLDEQFGRYWRDAPRKDRATIRQLLSHRSGIYNYFENPRYLAISGAWLRTSPAPGLLSREHRWTYDEIMDLVKTGYCRAGACYHYSNTNYVILGRVAEVVGGAPLHEQLRARFFEPLGLEDTVYQPAETPPLDAAHGHWDYGSGYSDHTRDAQVVPFMAAVSVADAAGAIASTARDLSVWAAALYGGQILSAASLEQMTRFLEPGLYGLGTDVAVFAGHRGYGHRGGLRGFEASMWYFPDEGVSVVLLSNQGNWLTDVPMEKLVRAVLGKD